MSPEPAKTGHTASQHTSASPSSAPPPGQGQAQGGQPTEEQLIQYMMIAKGLNRETAAEELFADPDKIKQEYAKLQQLMQSGQ